MSLVNYQKGRQIQSVSDFELSFWVDKFVVDFKNEPKVVARSFLISWQYKTLKDRINKGTVFVAEKIGEPEQKPVKEKKKWWKLWE